jgi:hypothetical protein
LEEVNVAIENDVFKNMELKEASAFVLKNPGDSSELKKVKLESQSNKGISFSSPKISLTMLTFNKNRN